MGAYSPENRLSDSTAKAQLNTKRATAQTDGRDWGESLMAVASSHATEPPFRGPLEPPMNRAFREVTAKVTIPAAAGLRVAPESGVRAAP